jgi:hypothetical protein
MFAIVPEYVIKNYAMLNADENNNIFQQALDEGKIYSEALITPVYIYNQYTRELSVTSEERLNKKYH